MENARNISLGVITAYNHPKVFETFKKQNGLSGSLESHSKEYYLWIMSRVMDTLGKEARNAVDDDIHLSVKEELKGPNLLSAIASLAEIPEPIKGLLGDTRGDQPLLLVSFPPNVLFPDMMDDLYKEKSAWYDR